MTATDSTAASASDRSSRRSAPAPTGHEPSTGPASTGPASTGPGSTGPATAEPEPSKGGRPIAAVLSQLVVAGTSLILQIIALQTSGVAGLGTFSLLFGILITINSVQSGWIGDSLTVLDRFDPGLRRALRRSQAIVVVVVFVVTVFAARLVDGISSATVWLFGLASVAWVLEETIRRLLIARREFWKLVVNDAAFAVGAFTLLGVAAATGVDITVETLMLALLAGALLAIAVGSVQLPRLELSAGLLGPSKMRELGSFAVWRAAQIGLRPGSQAVVRAVIVGVASVEALGRLEAARLLLAPMLTIVNGAGVYLLPTYSARVKRGQTLRPSVPLAMGALAAAGIAYGAIALVLRDPLLGLLADGEQVSATAVIGWALFAAGFGAGVPAGNALVAYGKSRPAFWLRVVDATLGVAFASALAAMGFVDNVPIGLAIGTIVGALLVLTAVRRTAAEAALVASASAEGGSGASPMTSSAFHEPVLAADEPHLDDTWSWRPTTPGPSSSLDHRAPVAPPARLARSANTSLPGRAFSRAGSPSDPNAPDANRAADAPATAAPITGKDSQGGVANDRRARPRQVVADNVRAMSAVDLAQRTWWLVPMLMVVATEYKFRRRSINDALSGAVDPFIAVELGIYGMIGVWAALKLGPRTPKLNGLLVLMWGYILTTAVSSLYSTFPLLALARGVQIIIIGLVMQLLAQDGTLRMFDRLLHAWVVLITISIGVGLVYVAPVTGPQEGRFTWLSVHSVSAGSMLAISVCVVFGMWLRAGSPGLPWTRNTYGLLFIVQLVALLMTRTRGSIGAAIIALGLMAWLWSTNRMKSQLVTSVAVGAGAFMFAFGGPILSFLLRTESTQSITTLNRRTEIWSLAWESFLDNPLQGLGFASARGVFYDDTGLGGAHNALINVMIDGGLSGLAWWLGLLICTTVVVSRRRRLNASLSQPWPGALGDRRTDDIVIIGIITASLLNSVTTEGLGAGVNVSAIWWYLLVVWLTILDRHQPDPDTFERQGFVFSDRRQARRSG